MSLQGAEEDSQKLYNLGNIVQRMKPKSQQSCIMDYFKQGIYAIFVGIKLYKELCCIYIILFIDKCV